jgi:hypothetical protein
MASPSRKRLLKTSEIIVGYAMSRLNRAYLDARNVKTWTAAYAQAEDLLKVTRTSFKNLRDEFDPYHGNARRGWIDRPMRQSRENVMVKLRNVSDAALLEIVDGILRNDADAVKEVVVPLSRPAKRFHNVAERLRTGRMAEDFFREKCQEITGVPVASLLDHRELFRGYDYGVRDRDEIAIEVKGMKPSAGDILFTDREWTEAKVRRQNYWLVVIANVESNPTGRCIPDPTAVLQAKCQYQTTITATWRAKVPAA